MNLATTLPLIDDARPIKQRVVVASFPERQNRMWRYFEQRRYQVGGCVHSICLSEGHTHRSPPKNATNPHTTTIIQRPQTNKHKTITSQPLKSSLVLWDVT